MVALSHAVGRPFAPVFQVRWLERGRQLLVVRMVLPAVEELSVVLELDVDRTQPPPRLRDAQRVEVLHYLNEIFPGERPIESKDRLPDGPILGPARPPLDGLVAPTLEALCKAGPAWSTAAAAAKNLPDASELGFAAFCIRRTPSWVTRRFRGALNQWQMAVEFFPRLRDKIFLPTRITEASPPVGQVHHPEELYCMTQFSLDTVTIEEFESSGGRIRREPTPPGGKEDEWEWAIGGYDWMSLPLRKALDRLPKRTRELFCFNNVYRLVRRNPRPNTNLWFYGKDWSADIPRGRPLVWFP